MLRSFLPKLTLLVASGLAGLLMLEIGVRLLGLSSPSVGRIDCVRGWALRPGVTVKKSREGSGLVSINSDGLRDDEHPKDRPEGAFRIAVLGDSFTLASHVEVDKTYWSILERLLGDCPALAGLQAARGTAWMAY